VIVASGVDRTYGEVAGIKGRVISVETSDGTAIQVTPGVRKMMVFRLGEARVY
jgi:hypothetical protein